MNIDYTALQKTKEACHEELDMIVNKIIILIIYKQFINI